jgi:ABC-type Fe3+ transport system substrate-binding protein
LFAKAGPGDYPGMMRKGIRFAALLFACVLPGPLHASQKLVLISPHGEGVRIEFARAFNEWHQANYGERVEFDWRDVGGTSDIIRFIRSEFKQRPTGIGIDMLFGGGIDPFLELQKDGVLTAYRPPDSILTNIPPFIGGVPLYEKDYHWFGAALTTFGMAKNKRVVELMGLPEAHEWPDLCQTNLVGWVGSGDPRSSGSVHMMYEIILQGYGWERGWEIIMKIAGNVRAYDKASSLTAKQATLGEVAYALAIDFYALTQVAEAGPENMEFVMPSGIAVVNPDCICLLKGGPNQVIAQRFLDFVLSEEGQKLWMLPRGHEGGARQFSIERMSILPSMYQRYDKVALVKTNPFALPIRFQYDPKKGGTRWSILNGLIGSTVIDVHDTLTAAWRSLIRRGLPVAEAQTFCQPPLSEDKLMALATGPWSAAAFRNRQQIEWQQEAAGKFRQILQNEGSTRSSR